MTGRWDVGARAVVIGFQACWEWAALKALTQAPRIWIGGKIREAVLKAGASPAGRPTMLIRPDAEGESASWGKGGPARVGVGGGEGGGGWLVFGPALGDVDQDFGGDGDFLGGGAWAGDTSFAAEDGFSLAGRDVGDVLAHGEDGADAVSAEDMGEGGFAG